MHNPIGLTLNIMREYHLNIRKSSISKTLLAFFAILETFFGLKFGINNFLSKDLKAAVKVMSLVMTFVLFVILLSPMTSLNHVRWWYFLHMVQYFLTYSVLWSSKYSFGNLFRDFIPLDKELNIDNGNAIGVVASCYTFMCFSAKWVLYGIHCRDYNVECVGSPFGYSVTFVTVLILDIIPVTHIILFVFLYCRVRRLKMALENSKMNLKSALNVYRGIADCFEKIQPIYDKLFILGLMFDVPHFMTLIYEVLFLLKRNEACRTLSFQYVFVIQMTIHICVPHIIAEMIESRVDNIKIILQEQRFYKDDDKSDREVSLMLQYMETRTLEHTVWGIIPVDVRFPMSLFNMCITYLIVFIQLTHLYD